MCESQRRRVLTVWAIGFALGASLVSSGDLVARLREDPAALRRSEVLRSFKGADPVAWGPVVAGIAAADDQDWDVRARAVTLLDSERYAAVVAAFAAELDPVIVAADPWGDEAFNILADWMTRRRDAGGAIGARLLPGDAAQLAEVLGRLAGRPVHDYLRLLIEQDRQLPRASIVALAATDDQLTRQVLCWYVGDRRLEGMEGFLVDQIASPRPSSYRSQVDRMMVAALTAGIGEIIRQLAPTPRWLEDDATPKGLALESLGRLIPVGSRIAEPAWTAALLEAASSNAAGKDRGQWQLAIDVLRFLAERGEALDDGRADAAVAALARQALRKRGPLEPFVAVARLHAEAGVAFPELGAEEANAVWEVAHTTLDPDFLEALVEMLPDRDRRLALHEHLLSLEAQAARGSLHVVRCWGADIEGPGDWALAVAALGISDAVDGVEQVLATSWTDEAATALARFGAAGAPALARHLRSERGPYLDREVRVLAIRACAEHLPAEEWQALAQALRGNRYLSESLAEALAAGD